MGLMFITSTSLAHHLFLLGWLKLDLILLSITWDWLKEINSCHHEDTWIVFSGSIVLPDSQETELGSSNQTASPSARKNRRIVLVPCHVWMCDPTAISGGTNIFKVSGCHLLWQMSSQWGSQKLLQGLVNSQPTVLARPILANLFWWNWQTRWTLL